METTQNTLCVHTAPTPRCPACAPDATPLPPVDETQRAIDTAHEYLLAARRARMGGDQQLADGHLATAGQWRARASFRRATERAALVMRARDIADRRARALRTGHIYR